MSRLPELLAELCPDGVEHQPLGDLARTVNGLTGKKKADFSDGNAKFITYKNVFSNPTVDQNIDDFVKVGVGERQNVMKLGDVILTGSSESREEVGLSSVVDRDPTESIYLNSFCFALRFKDPNVINPNFAKHMFRSSSIRQQITKAANGVTRINISKPRLMRIEIPVPPLEVQQEIVRVLDAFTDLEQSLVSELQLRKKQFEQFKSSILHMNSLGAKPTPLEGVGRWFGGGTPSKKNPTFWEEGDIPWISPKDMGGSVIRETQDYITSQAVSKSSTKLVPENSVAVVVRSSILDHTLPIAFVPMPSTLNQDMKAVVTREDIIPKYFYHALSASREHILLTVRRRGGSVASLDSKKLREYEILIPSPDVQQEVVDKLDSFESLIESIEQEIVLRRKQYEFYRDELLTFTPKES